MRTTAIALTLAAAAIGSGCGDDSDEPAGTQEKAARLAPVAAVEKDPQQLSCGHLADPVISGNISRRVTVALADELLERNKRYAKTHNRLQASQSIFFAVTEICKGREPDHKPVAEALRGVESGKYEADLG